MFCTFIYNIFIRGALNLFMVGNLVGHPKRSFNWEPLLPV